MVDAKSRAIRQCDRDPLATANNCDGPRFSMKIRVFLSEKYVCFLENHVVLFKKHPDVLRAHSCFLKSHVEELKMRAIELDSHADF